MKSCYCETCRKLYRQQYGADISPKEAGHPELRKLASFQAESMRRFYEHSHAAVKSVRPDVALYGNSGTREEPYYTVGRNNRVLIKSQDVLGAEGGFIDYELSKKPVWRVGSNAKYCQTQAGGKPTLVFNSPAYGPWRSYYQTETELRLALAQPPINGSGV